MRAIRFLLPLLTLLLAACGGQAGAPDRLGDAGVCRVGALDDARVARRLMAGEEMEVPVFSSGRRALGCGPATIQVAMVSRAGRGRQAAIEAASLLPLTR